MWLQISSVEVKTKYRLSLFEKVKRSTLHTATVVKSATEWSSLWKIYISSIYVADTQISDLTF